MQYILTLFNQFDLGLVLRTTSLFDRRAQELCNGFISTLLLLTILTFLHGTTSSPEQVKKVRRCAFLFSQKDALRTRWYMAIIVVIMDLNKVFFQKKNIDYFADLINQHFTFPNTILHILEICISFLVMRISI